MYNVVKILRGELRPHLKPETKSESREDLNLPFSGAGFAVFRRDEKTSS